MKKTKKPQKRKPEEPRQTAILDEMAIVKWCKIQATDQEIADVCGVPLELLLEKFGELMRRTRALGRIEIREAMHALATSRLGVSSQMAVWLSKQHLGMRDPEKEEKDEDKLDGVEVVDYSKEGK